MARAPTPHNAITIPHPYVIVFFFCIFVFWISDEEDEGAIGADWAMGAEGAEGAMGSEGVVGSEEDKGAAIYLMLDG